MTYSSYVLITPARNEVAKSQIILFNNMKPLHDLGLLLLLFLYIILT